MDDIHEPSISVRNHIRWLPDEASEPTSTLVLTSKQRFFIDIRILKPTKEGEPDLPNEGGPLSRLEWGFAGTSSTTLTQTNPDNDSAEPIPHSKWNHWIDSQHDGPVTDEGDMYPQPDGAVLEKGNMVNPATGLMTDYEELWTDLEPSSTEKRQERWSVVLILDDEASGTKGMVIRVGEYVQGIIKVNRQITVERWAWEDGKDGAKAWTRMVRLGDYFLPCSLGFYPEKIALGGEVAFGDFKWVVSELYHW